MIHTLQTPNSNTSQSFSDFCCSCISISLRPLKFFVLIAGKPASSFLSWQRSTIHTSAIFWSIHFRSSIQDHAIQRLCTNSTNRCIHFEWFTVFSFHTCCASHRYWNPSEKIQKQIAPKRMQNNLDFVYGTESENAQIAIHETRCTMHFDFKFAYEPLISICNSVWRMLLTAEEKNTSSKQTVYISPLVINTTIVLYRYYLLLNNRRSNVDKRGRTPDPISHRHSRVRVEGRHLHHQIDTCDAKWCDSMCVSN